MKKESKENKPATFTAIIKVNMIINEPIVKAKAKQSQRPTRRKKNIFKSQSEFKVKPTKLPKARENAGVQVIVAFSFASDWLKDWWQFSGPITERSKAKPVQSQITFDTQLKNCSIVYVFLLLVRRG